jgi:ATP-dependent Clp protease adaptor protein ClpS
LTLLSYIGAEGYITDTISIDMAQEELKKRPSGNVRTAPREPRRYIVSVLNDDFTTFEFVIEIMMTIFNKSRSEAEAIAESTHLHQKANVGIYSLDIARSKVDKATALARAEGFPLKFEIQPE